MRLTPASRHMSTCRLASATSVDPTFLNGPRPPNVIVPMVSTETRKPDLPNARYSMGTTLPSATGVHPPRPRPSTAYGPGACGVPPGQLAVGGGIRLHPLPGPSGDLPG